MRPDDATPNHKDQQEQRKRVHIEAKLKTAMQHDQQQHEQPEIDMIAEPGLKCSRRAPIRAFTHAIRQQD